METSVIVFFSVLVGAAGASLMLFLLSQCKEAPPTCSEGCKCFTEARKEELDKLWKESRELQKQIVPLLQELLDQAAQNAGYPKLADNDKEDNDDYQI